MTMICLEYMFIDVAYSRDNKWDSPASGKTSESTRIDHKKSFMFYIIIC